MVNGTSPPTQIGFLSLNIPLQPDEVLGVAYQYTYNGKLYQVGEFSEGIALDPNKGVQQILYLKLLSNYSYDEFEFDSFKKSSKLQYGAHNNIEIPFYRIKFDSVGLFYINGVIEDFVYIDLKEKDKNGKNLKRLIEVQEELLHKVVVIHQPNSTK